MEPLALTGNYRMVAAIILGIFFGFILIKSDLAFRKNCLDAVLLKNGRVLKTMLISLAVGVIIFFFAERSGLVHLQVRTGYFWASLIGGILAGLGFALCARVPVSAIAGLAAGRVYVVWVIVGMLLAIPCVQFMSNLLTKSIYSWSAPIETQGSISAFFDVANPALWVAGVALLLTLLFHFTLGGDESDK
jgi:hypothetical protein